MDMLNALGFGPEDRVAVVHVDDIGMSHPANVGGVRALDGAATCASIMMPCPGFEEITAIARRRPELDLGIHLTMNSEFPDFRWGPARDDVPSLCRADGTLWQTARETIANADPDEVAREITTQIEAVLAAGVDATHIDNHMGTLSDRKFFDIYIQSGIDYNLPVLMPRKISPGLLAEHGIGLSPDYDARLNEMEERGFQFLTTSRGRPLVQSVHRRRSPSKPAADGPRRADLLHPPRRRGERRTASLRSRLAPAARGASPLFRRDHGTGDG